jgi:DNA replication protein DnaC
MFMYSGYLCRFAGDSRCAPKITAALKKLGKKEAVYVAERLHNQHTAVGKKENEVYRSCFVEFAKLVQDGLVEEIGIRSILVYGARGAGKSYMAANALKVLYMMTTRYLVNGSSFVNVQQT